MMNSSPNFPSGLIRSGFSYNICQPPFSLDNSSQSQLIQHSNPPLLPQQQQQQQQQQHVFSSAGSLNSAVHNFALITSSQTLMNTSNQNASFHPVYGNIFQSLLSNSTPTTSNPTTLLTKPSDVPPSANAAAAAIVTPTTLIFQPTTCLYPVFKVAVTAANSQVTSSAAVATKTTTSKSKQGQESHCLLESLFSIENVVNEAVCTIKSHSFLHWAMAAARSYPRDRLTVWPRRQIENDLLHTLNWTIAPPGLLNIYSESPFLRPILTLRKVEFAAPGNINPNIPDLESMVRTLREIADAKVSKYAASFGGGPNPTSAASVGFTTDFMTHVFTLDLDRHVVKLLAEQMRQTSKRPGGPEWHVILRLGWACMTDFYVPKDPDGKPLQTLVFPEALPRCLSIRVVGRSVTLPDPIFHGGQAQKLGKRLRLSIDITDKIPIKPNNPTRNKVLDIEITWLHAPLEDQSTALLPMVANGELSPLFCHLIGLPVVQITLDRFYPIAELCSIFDDDTANARFNQSAVVPKLDNSVEIHKVCSHPLATKGTYDFCVSQCRRITTGSIKSEIKSRFEKFAQDDNDVSIEDTDVEVSDYIPLCLLCPLTRTRINIPVRSCNCTHFQCFDLHSYLSINLRRPRWCCPLCSTPAPFRDLRLDELFQSILKNPQTADQEFVRIDPQGDWYLPTTVTAVSIPSKINPKSPSKMTALTNSDAADVPPLPASSEPIMVKKDGDDETTSTAATTTTTTTTASPRIAAVNSGDNQPIVIVVSDDDDGDTAAAAVVSKPNSELVKKDGVVAKKIAQPPITNNFMEIDLTIDDDDDEDDDDCDDYDAVGHNDHSYGFGQIPSNGPTRSVGHAVECNKLRTNSLSLAQVRSDNPMVLVPRLADQFKDWSPASIQDWWMEKSQAMLLMMSSTQTPPTTTMPSAPTTVTNAFGSSVEAHSRFYHHLLEATSRRVNQSSTTGSRRNRTTKPMVVMPNQVHRRLAPAVPTKSSTSTRKAMAGNGTGGRTRLVHLSDDDEFLSDDSSLLPSSSSATANRPPQPPSRRFAPMVKSNQSIALARLVQDRMHRPAASTSSHHHQQQHKPPAKRSTRSQTKPTVNPSTTSTVKKRYMPPTELDDQCSDEYDDDAVDAADIFDEDSWDSSSSDDRWSPSRSHPVAVQSNSSKSSTSRVSKTNKRKQVF